MDFSGPDAIDQAIEAGIDLDGSPIPVEMLKLYKEVMDQEGARKRSGVKKSMRNRIVRSGAKHFDQESLNQRLIAAGWEGLKSKEIEFFFSWFGLYKCDIIDKRFVDRKTFPGCLYAKSCYQIDTYIRQ